VNQATNLIQWKNLTEDQKANFDFENYKYELQSTIDWVMRTSKSIGLPDVVYRLVIDPEKFYFVDSHKYTIPKNKNIIKGCDFGEDHFDDSDYCILRPAKPHEIPQPEKTLEQRIQEKWPDKKVEMLDFNAGDCLAFVNGRHLGRLHFEAQSMKGFYKYVYDFGDGELTLFHEPLDVFEDKTFHPVAALFEDRCTGVMK